jgi:hypothetical protein
MAWDLSFDKPPQDPAQAKERGKKVKSTQNAELSLAVERLE